MSCIVRTGVVFYVLTISSKGKCSAFSTDRSRVKFSLRVTLGFPEVLTSSSFQRRSKLDSHFDHYFVAVRNVQGW